MRGFILASQALKKKEEIGETYPHMISNIRPADGPFQSHLLTSPSSFNVSEFIPVQHKKTASGLMAVIFIAKRLNYSDVSYTSWLPQVGCEKASTGTSVPVLDMLKTCGGNTPN